MWSNFTLLYPPFVKTLIRYLSIKLFIISYSLLCPKCLAWLCLGTQLAKSTVTLSHKRSSEAVWLLRKKKPYKIPSPNFLSPKVGVIANFCLLCSKWVVSSQKWFLPFLCKTIFCNIKGSFFLVPKIFDTKIYCFLREIGILSVLIRQSY